MRHHRRSKNRAVLLPRSHRKTTYATQHDAIQISLPDDLGSDVYPYNLGPEVRILIAHESGTSAQRFLQYINSQFLQNSTLQFLFPEIIPSYKEQRINVSEFELRRTSPWSEPTFDTMGVGTKGQGRHYNKIKLDDIFGIEAMNSPTTRQKTIEWFDGVEPLLVTPKTDGFDLIGTRYSFDDVYQHAFDKYGDQLPRYVRSAEEYIDGKWQALCPELLDLEDMKHLKKNRKLWISNYLNKPDNREDPEFQPEWLRYWEKRDHRGLVAFTGTERLSRDYDALDKLILIDPALNGDAGWVVTGTDYIADKPNVFVLEAERGIFPPEQLIEKIFTGVLRWNPRAVIIEEVLFSKLYQHWLSSEMRHRRIYFKVIGAKTGGKHKDARTRGLAPYFNAGQMFLNLNQEALLTEYNQFGLGDSYHVLDALAYGPEHWRASADRNTIEKRRQAEQKFRDMRDPRTGYSKVG